MQAPQQGDAGLFFAYFDNGGFDHVFKLLLGLVPHHQALATRICRHIGVAKLDGFHFAGFPVFKGHEFLGHSVHIARRAGSDQKTWAKRVGATFYSQRFEGAQHRQTMG